MAGLAFKISAVPFHMWVPMSMKGAPTPVTAFFASAPKIAAFAITVRVVITAFPGISMQWQQIVVFISILSMALGSFAAIGQHNIKRLMAYSSIGHVGFALVGLAAGNEAGVAGVLFYMGIYLVMLLGTFAAILSMRVGGRAVENIRDLAGLARTDGTMAFFLAMLMFSLAGIPPLAGFFAKFYVFYAAVEAHLYWLAVIGFVTSVVAAFYYLQIVKIIYFDEPAASFDRPAPVLACRSGRKRPRRAIPLCLSGAIRYRGSGRRQIAVLILRDTKPFQLAESALRDGFQVLTFETIGSTNDAAMAAARIGGLDRCWFIARTQTGGRGRHGRSWASPPGNLYASLLLVDVVPIELAPQLGFVAGVAPGARLARSCRRRDAAHAQMAKRRSVRWR